MQREQLFLITPFRDCARQLGKIAWEMGWTRDVQAPFTPPKDERRIVILVLGGGDQSGPKNWVAEKPNMLNVAVSRAKKRIYVIGDRADWNQRRYFDEAVRHLPVARPGTPERRIAPRPEPTTQKSR